MSIDSNFPIPTIADFLQLLLGEMGEKLEGTSVPWFTRNDVAQNECALDTWTRSRRIPQAGAAIGELIGTIMLELKIVPKKIRTSREKYEK